LEQWLYWRKSRYFDTERRCKELFQIINVFSKWTILNFSKFIITRSTCSSSKAIYTRTSIIIWSNSCNRARSTILTWVWKASGWNKNVLFLKLHKTFLSLSEGPVILPFHVKKVPELIAKKWSKKRFFHFFIRLFNKTLNFSQKLLKSIFQPKSRN
jgi:hypothetical protein